MFLLLLKALHFTLVEYNDDLALFNSVVQFLHMSHRLQWHQGWLDLETCPWELECRLIPELSGLCILHVRIGSLTDPSINPQVMQVIYLYLTISWCNLFGLAFTHFKSQHAPSHHIYVSSTAILHAWENAATLDGHMTHACMWSCTCHGPSNFLWTVIIISTLFFILVFLFVLVCTTATSVLLTLCLLHFCTYESVWLFWITKWKVSVAQLVLWKQNLVQRQCMEIRKPEI